MVAKELGLLASSKGKGDWISHFAGCEYKISHVTSMHNCKGLKCIGL